MKIDQFHHGYAQMETKITEIGALVGDEMIFFEKEQSERRNNSFVYYRKPFQALLSDQAVIRL
jgi:hypothetical protein